MHISINNGRAFLMRSSAFKAPVLRLKLINKYRLFYHEWDILVIEVGKDAYSAECVASPKD